MPAGRGEATAVTGTTVSPTAADGLGIAELGDLAGLDREGAAADFGLKMWWFGYCLCVIMK